ncbi:MAG TPA: alpha/beta fold hydrolase [Acidimicrobiales bacterium]|nr:alpha/beta fold hydrolase [Acidimicrobiales bacterium]
MSGVEAAGTRAPTRGRRVLEISGIPSAVDDLGDGTPVVFLHGAGRLGGTAWAETLADEYRVVLPVHPGFGDSGDDPTIDSIHDYVLHYLDLFDELGLERFHLIGHSLGGYLAASFAVEHAARLASLVLVSPAGLLVPEAPTVDMFRIPPQEVLGYLTDRPERYGDPAAPPDVDQLVERYRESTTVAQLFWERNFDLKLARWLHRVKVPTLMIWGERDRLVPAAQAPTWLSLLPDARLELVADAGHLVLGEVPEAPDLIRRFLAEHPLG